MDDQQDSRFDGKCTCGAVRYRLNRKPMFVHCCHCSWCQRQTGSAFVINALIESDQIEVLSGNLETTKLPSPSGKGQHVIRCSECRITLWSHYGGAGDKISFVRVGTLDEPNRLPPDIHIYTSSKLPWVVLPEGIPAFHEYYDRKQYWPQDSQARLKALMN